MSQVENPEALIPRSGQHFSPGRQQVIDAENYTLNQFMVEESNVDPVEELVNMVAIQRRYDAAQRSMKTMLDLRGISDMLRGLILNSAVAQRFLRCFRPRIRRCHVLNALKSPHICRIEDASENHIIRK